jgi:hypothetical protein
MFLPTVTKATRISRDAATFIDQILTNNTNNMNNAGTLISDLSDHFFNFIATPNSQSPNVTHQTTRRDINNDTINRFSNHLGAINWGNVIGCQDANMALDLFWQEFSTLYELNFPFKTFRANKNTQPKNNFMTNGLLISRVEKANLHKKTLIDPSQSNITKYKKYRNVYNTLIRCSKKLYFINSLKASERNPKKPGIF